MSIHDKNKKLLREKAEKLLGSDDAETVDLSRERMREIIHELRVHQIELELQNEEMQRTYSELVAVRDGFARLFNNSPVGYLLLDSNGLIMMANKTFSEMAGRSEGSLTGKSFAELLSSPDREIFIGRWKAFYKNPADKNITVKLPSAGNSSIYIRLTGRLEPEGLITQPGTSYASGILVIANDVTSQKKADEELFKTERKFRLLTENIDQTFWLKDRVTGLIEYISPAYELMWGESCDNLYKNPMSFLQSIHPDDLDTVKKMQQSLLSENKMFNMEYRIIKPDGDVRWISARTYPVTGPDGEIIKFAGIAEDITEKKIQNDNIQRLLAEKELILKEVHHRIKNNMNTVHSLLSLQAGFLEDPLAITALQDTICRVDSMVVLYDKLYSSHNFQDISVLTYLPSLIDEIIANFQGSESVRVEKKIDDFILSVKTLQPLGIIINELLTNIMKYAFTGRDNNVINVSATLSGENVCIIISDNGKGIPESITFETTTGFGMQLVSMLARQIGGSVKIERGEGTKFIIEFCVS